MAVAMNEMMCLSFKEQESILKHLEARYLPIQIEKDVFLIPMPVHEMINDMYRELDKLRELKESISIGEKKDKRQ